MELKESKTTAHKSAEDEGPKLPKGSIRSKKVLDVALNLASNGGEDTVVYDIHDKTPLTSYAILCSAGSSKRLNGLVSRSKEALAENGFSINHVEGKRESTWMLVDAGYIVIHIFSREERKRVDLDSLYKGTPKTSIHDEDIKNYVTYGIKKTRVKKNESEE